MYKIKVTIFCENIIGGNIMKLTVLGTVSPYLRFDHNGPGFLIEDDVHKVLLDCGSGITRCLKLPYHLEGLHIFVSHFHRDHYNEIYNIQYASHTFHNLGELQQPIDIYLPITPPERYSDVVTEEYAFANYHKILDEFNGVQVGNLNVTFCLTGHTAESYAFKVSNGKNTIVYTSDISFEAKDAIAKFAKDADLLICDSSLLESYGFPEINSHITAKQAATIASESNVKQLMLTHFWPAEFTTRKHIEEAITIFDDVIAAYEGTEIYLD